MSHDRRSIEPKSSIISSTPLCLSKRRDTIKPTILGRNAACRTALAIIRSVRYSTSQKNHSEHWVDHTTGFCCLDFNLPPNDAYEGDIARAANGSTPTVLPRRQILTLAIPVMLSMVTTSSEEQGALELKHSQILPDVTEVTVLQWERLRRDGQWTCDPFYQQDRFMTCTSMGHMISKGIWYVIFISL